MFSSGRVPLSVDRLSVWAGSGRDRQVLEGGGGRPRGGEGDSHGDDCAGGGGYGVSRVSRCCREGWVGYSVGDCM